MTKRPSQPIHFKDQDQKDRFAQAAIAAGFETGRGPGITAWLKMLGEREIGEAETVTFESMTPGERWHFLDEVVDHSADAGCVARASKLCETIESEEGGYIDWEPVYEVYKDNSHPGYLERYNAALAYVKGVLND